MGHSWSPLSGQGSTPPALGGTLSPGCLRSPTTAVARPPPGPLPERPAQRQRPNPPHSAGTVDTDAIVRALLPALQMHSSVTSAAYPAAPPPAFSRRLPPQTGPPLPIPQTP